MKKILEAPSRRVANIFNEVDTNFIEICNNLIRIIYPDFTLANYAEPQNEPTLPTLNNCYLVKETGTVWSLAVEKNDVILFNGTDWEILAHKINEINAGLNLNSVAFRVITEACTLTLNDEIVQCSLTNHTTIYLPTAVGIAGKKYIIKNLSNYILYIAADGTELIDNALNKSLNVNQFVTVISNNSNWIII